MKKFINNPADFESDMLEGILGAHAGLLRSVRDDHRAIVRQDAPIYGKVGLLTGGGSGHLPLFLGYVGEGMLDGVAVGDVFASPNARMIVDATRAVSGGAGVLYVYGNYGGDVLNFGMAAEIASAEGIRVETVVATDDVASAPKGEEEKRRGVAGLFYLYKVAGAMADNRGTLLEIKEAVELTNARVRTMGVGFSPCYLPANGRPSFDLDPDQMEMGLGIHGEPGMERLPIATAREITNRIMTAIYEDLQISPGARVSVLINGLGATSREELYILYREVALWLQQHAITIVQPYVGEFATSLEMAGASISVLWLTPDLESLIAAPCATPFWKQVKGRE